MLLADLKQEIDQRASDMLMEHLFAKSTAIHAKREWRDCDCTFCAEKRKATKYVGLGLYPPSYYDHPINIYDKNERRAIIRQWFRARLKNLKTA